MPVIKYCNYIIILLLISSCGFKPLYGINSSEITNKNIHKMLSEIMIESIPSIEGAEFYHTLNKLLPYGKQKRFLLKSELQYDTSQDVISKRSNVLRQSKTLKLHYKLISLSNNEVIKSNDIIKVSSYSSGFKPYNVYIIDKNIESNLAINMAHTVYYELILCFLKY